MTVKTRLLLQLYPSFLLLLFGRFKVSSLEGGNCTVTNPLRYAPLNMRDAVHGEPEKYVILRRDFYEGICPFCNRVLEIGIALILRHKESGSMCGAGPECGPKRADNPKGYPDFTRGSVAEAAGGKCDKSSPGGRRGSYDAEWNEGAKDLARAIEYLELRQLRLKDFGNFKSPALAPLLDKHLQGSLDARDVAKILHFAQNAKSKDPMLSLANLQACYAFDHWLERAIGKSRRDGKDSSDPQELRVKLCKWGYLTAWQVNQAKDCFEKLSRVPRLRSGTFADVERFQNEKWAAKRQSAST